ncbi:hypothetical protein G6F50_016394 [Rhizopus delemar]|uniref:Uncharacterized protein n=1 Tax=Rhizopus delemar TaxID=936053 RepID=A0A9P6XT56_9FUNG|nr:hypothetical protein G6F50_016394 [Rhizopus delemar]
MGALYGRTYTCVYMCILNRIGYDSALPHRNTHGRRHRPDAERRCQQPDPPNGEPRGSAGCRAEADRAAPQPVHAEPA